MDINICRGDAGTVHKYEGDSKQPQCGAYAPKGPAKSHGAKRRHEVDLEDVEPWNLCQDCFPNKYKKYPENDHYFDVSGRYEYNGTLGSDYSHIVQCQKCDFEQPASTEREAYYIGYEHKRYPDKEPPL